MREKECGCEKCQAGKKKSGKGMALSIVTVRRLPMPARKATKGEKKP
jgi:hypothetical protein